MWGAARITPALCPGPLLPPRPRGPGAVAPGARLSHACEDLFQSSVCLRASRPAVSSGHSHRRCRRARAVTRAWPVGGKTSVEAGNSLRAAGRGSGLPGARPRPVLCSRGRPRRLWPARHLWSVLQVSDSGCQPGLLPCVRSFVHLETARARSASRKVGVLGKHSHGGESGSTGRDTHLLRCVLRCRLVLPSVCVAFFKTDNRVVGPCASFCLRNVRQSGPVPSRSPGSRRGPAALPGHPGLLARSASSSRDPVRTAPGTLCGPSRAA